MSNGVLSQRLHGVMVLAPDADLYAADPATDIVNMGRYGHAQFVIMEGAGGTGTVKIEVEACSDNTGSDNEAIAFKVREGSAADPEVNGTLTDVAAAGHTTTAGAQKVVVVEVDSEDLPEGKPWLRLQLTEVADSPCDAGVWCNLSEPRYPQETMLSAV